MTNLPILYVEDAEHDVLFLDRAFKKAEILNPVHIARDGRETVDCLARNREDTASPPMPLPCLIILDLKLPRMTGLEVLLWLRRESGLPPLPVIMFSSSSHGDDIKRALSLGANAFVVKPRRSGQWIHPLPTGANRFDTGVAHAPPLKSPIPAPPKPHAPPLITPIPPRLPISGLSNTAALDPTGRHRWRRSTCSDRRHCWAETCRCR